MKFKSTLTLLLGLINLSVFAQSISPFIVVDNFGYRPQSSKIAVLRDPVDGADGDLSFSPGTDYSVVNTSNNTEVFNGSPTIWNAGATDNSSGDKVQWFDFSSVTNPGTYYVLDKTNNVRSNTFEIRENIYNDVLKQAFRTFFYQRSGYAKEAQYAGEGYADGASHLGNLQDLNCRSYDDPNNASTEMNVYGGWYDAGDLNKYSPWTARYVIDMLKTYEESPDAWGDDYNLPQSGNSIPDIVDEAKWGAQHLLRLQKSDGSIVSVIDASHASPPSSATGQSLYGAPNVNTNFEVGAAYAKAAISFKDLGQTDFSDSLKAAALKAWDWAHDNYFSVWRNNDAGFNSQNIGSGKIDTSRYDKLVNKLEMAVYLFELTDETKYRDTFDLYYEQVHLIPWWYAYPYELEEQETLLHYASLPNATANISSTILSRYANAMQKDETFTAVDDALDPYRAYLKSYTWGSSNIKARSGLMFTDLIHHNVIPTRHDDALAVAEDYIHYLHGVNPLAKCYLTNMGDYGGENSVSELFHTWFANGSAKWDKVGESTYGPPPGFLVGGANNSYNKDGCCPSGCGSSQNNALCNSVDVSGIIGAPQQKSYMDFNDSWPLNSWEITENSCGYQTSYLRLLAHFVHFKKDCEGVIDGTSGMNNCGDCSTTPGVTESCGTTSTILIDLPKINIYPNPSKDKIYFDVTASYEVFDIRGLSLLKGNGNQVNISSLSPGTYLIKINNQTLSFIKE